MRKEGLENVNCGLKRNAVYKVKKIKKNEQCKKVLENLFV